ncbi:MAG: hypothetical protein V1755_01590 [Chloroflexota bacterium]
MITTLLSAARDLLQNCLISEAEQDRKGQPANIVDALYELARAIRDASAKPEKTKEKKTS